MKVLLTNDDGVEAPGLDALERLLARYAEVTVIAPDRHLSGCSHQVSTHRPLQVQQISGNRHAVDGTPADCVRLGLHHLAPDADWVIAGINDGGNLGVDVYMSGTVAAVREAALFGKPAIAFSRYRRKGRPVDWSAVVPMVARVFEELLQRSLACGAFWNVNLPDLDKEDESPEIVTCPLDSSPLSFRYESQKGKFQYRGIYHQRGRQEGSDVDVCFSGRIAVTQVLPPWSRDINV